MQHFSTKPRLEKLNTSCMNLKLKAIRHFNGQGPLSSCKGFYCETVLQQRTGHAVNFSIFSQVAWGCNLIFYLSLDFARTKVELNGCCVARSGLNIALASCTCNTYYQSGLMVDLISHPCHNVYTGTGSIQGAFKTKDCLKFYLFVAFTHLRGKTSETSPNIGSNSHLLSINYTTGAWHLNFCTPDSKSFFPIGACSEVCIQVHVSGCVQSRCNQPKLGCVNRFTQSPTLMAVSFLCCWFKSCFQSVWHPAAHTVMRSA